MASVQWIKYQSGKWCDLNTLELGIVGNVTGVYIIWYGGKKSRIIKIGQGNIKEGIKKSRANIQIQKFSHYGTLHVTWAEVPPFKIGGIERYLLDTWKPLISSKGETVPPIEVNSPFAKK